MNMQNNCEFKKQKRKKNEAMKVVIGVAKYGHKFEEFSKWEKNAKNVS